MAQLTPKHCCWCGRQLASRIYRPAIKIHKYTTEDLVFCNHAEYSAYVKEEREARVTTGGFDCPPNA